MEVKPEDYLNLDTLELYGPDAVKPQAAPVAANTNTLESIQQSLFQAQRNGDNAAIGLLSSQLDSLLAATTTSPDVAPEAPQAPEDKPEDDLSQEDLETLYKSSEVRQELYGKYGKEEVDSVHTWLNGFAEKDELSSYIALLANDDPEALLTYESLRKMAGDESIQPDQVVEYQGFDGSQSQQLLEEFGDHGQTMLDLNTQYLAGQITQTQMQRAVLSDPALAMSVFQAKAQGLITY